MLTLSLSKSAAHATALSDVTLLRANAWVGAVRALVCSASVGLLLAGCGALPTPQAAPALYDFGGLPAVEGQQAPAPNARNATVAQRPVVMREVTAQGLPANSQVMLYRLNYAEDMQLRGYQAARWSQPVQKLVNQQLRDRLALTRPVLTDDVDLNVSRRTGQPLPPVLYVNLVRFEQAFSAADASAAVVQAQATLIEPGVGGDRLLGQRQFDYSVAAPSANATGGARALAQASQQLTMDIDAWLAQLLTATESPAQAK